MASNIAKNRVERSGGCLGIDRFVIDLNGNKVVGVEIQNASDFFSRGLSLK